MIAVSPKNSMNAAVVRFNESTLDFGILVAMDSAGNYTLRKGCTSVIIHWFDN